MQDSLVADHSFGPDLLVHGLGNGIWRLSEPTLSQGERSFFYLVAGAQGLALIDGGWGLGAGLPPDLARRADLTAVATHSHFDHIGHLHEVSRRLAHPAEAAVFADPAPDLTQATPYLHARPVLQDGGCLDLRAWGQSPCPLTGTITEGAVIDLGDRRLQVLHTPGHSPGSISLFDAGTATLFCGDVLLPGHIYDDIPGADPALIRASHHRLAALPFRWACGGHGPVMSRAEALARMARYAGERQD